MKRVLGLLLATVLMVGMSMPTFAQDTKGDAKKGAPAADKKDGKEAATKKDAKKGEKKAAKKGTDKKDAKKDATPDKK